MSAPNIIGQVASRDLNRTLGSPAQAGNGVQLIAAFGDSMIERAVTASESAQTISYNANSPISWLQFLSKGKLWMPYVVRVELYPSLLPKFTVLKSYCNGVGGRTTADLLKITSEIINLNPLPRFVYFMAGTNDIERPATRNDTVDQIFTRWATIVEQFIDAGMIVGCCTILPRGSMASGASGSRPGWGILTDAEILTARGKLMEINNRIRAFCQGRPGAVLIDPWAKLVDYATSTSDAVSALTSNNDFVHPNDLACLYIGQSAIAALTPYLPADTVLDFAGGGDTYSATNQPYGSFFDGSFAVGTGGTTTAPFTAGAGGNPTDWTANRLSGAGASTGVIQKLTRGFGTAMMCNLVYTGGAGGPDIFRVYKAGSTVASSNFSAGDAWYATQDVSVVATGEYSCPDMECRQGGSAFIFSLHRSVTAFVPVDVPGTYEGRLRSPLIVQPAAPLSLNCWSYDRIGTVCDATVNRWDLQLRKYNPNLDGAVIF